jgi:hypothetical protein
LTFFEQIKGMNKGESYLEAVRRGGPNRGKGEKAQKTPPTSMGDIGGDCFMFQSPQGVN